MTAARSTYRRRRASAHADLPDDLAAWFEGTFEREEGPPQALTAERRALLEAMPEHALGRGERRALGLPVEPWRPVPWSALIYPDAALLHERWMAWKAEHPDAVPPIGWEHIEKAPTGHAAEVVVRAREIVSQRRR